MTRKTFSLGLLTGLIVGVVAAVGFSGGHATPRALAQAQPQPSADPRFYLISAWAHPGSPGGAPAHGAYVLDAASGEVFLIEGAKAPQSIGRVPNISDPLRTPQTPLRELRQ